MDYSKMSLKALKDRKKHFKTCFYKDHAMSYIANVDEWIKILKMKKEMKRVQKKDKLAIELKVLPIRYPYAEYCKSLKK